MATCRDERFAGIYWRRVSAEDQREARERMMREKLGERDYREAVRVRQWIEGHRERAVLMEVIVRGEGDR